MLLTLIFFTAINFGIIYGILYVFDKCMKSLKVEHEKINEKILEKPIEKKRRNLRKKHDEI